MFLTIVKPKLRKVERRLVPVVEMLSVDELMETNTYQRFNRLIDAVFDVVDDENFVNDAGLYILIHSLLKLIILTAKIYIILNHLLRWM